MGTGRMSDDQLINGEWIRSRLRSHRRTQRDLAGVLGVDASAVSRVLDGHRKLRSDEAARIRAFFDPAAESPIAPAPAFRLATIPESGRPRPGPPPRQRATGDIPVYGAPAGLGRPFFEFPAGPAMEYRPRPNQLSGVEDAFAIYAPGDFLAPRFRSAETLYVHPNKPPTVGSDCFLRMRAPDRAMAVLRFLGSDAAALGFSSVSSPHPCTAVPRGEILTLNHNEVLQIGRIVLVATD
jgi:plasmid maintenance system antidote protein VapI